MFHKIRDYQIILMYIASIKICSNCITEYSVKHKTSEFPGNDHPNYKFILCNILSMTLSYSCPVTFTPLSSYKTRINALILPGVSYKKQRNQSKLMSPWYIIATKLITTVPYLHSNKWVTKYRLKSHLY